jgi:Family of unknown function (DUF5995)
MPDPNITAIIHELEEIVETCIQQANPHGLFAALYLKVTRRVREGIQQQHFEDNARMEQFDVIFARRYIDAYQAHVAGMPTSAAWHLAFEAIEKRDMLAIQHLLLGMNAHINLDLGIVAAQVSRGTVLANLETDFNRINDLLMQLLDEVQQEIDRISPVMWLIDWLFTKKDEQFAGFSMQAARSYAWKSAQLLHAMPSAAWTEQITVCDQGVTLVGKGMLSPPRIFRGFLTFVRRFEDRDVAGQIRRIGA